MSGLFRDKLVVARGGEGEGLETGEGGQKEQTSF